MENNQILTLGLSLPIPLLPHDAVDTGRLRWKGILLMPSNRFLMSNNGQLGLSQLNDLRKLFLLTMQTSSAQLGHELTVRRKIAFG